MTKKETFKWVVQIIASIATAILTAMGTVSCIGYKTKKRAFWNDFPERLVFSLCVVMFIIHEPRMSSYADQSS